MTLVDLAVRAVLYTDITTGQPVTSRRDWMATRDRLETLERQTTARSRLVPGCSGASSHCITPVRE